MGSGRRMLLAAGAGAMAVRLLSTRRAAPVWSPGSGVERDLSLHVRTAGCGPPVVLVHGFLGSGRYWGAAYDALAVGHQVIVPDLLGFGRSVHPATGYSADAHADALLRLLDDLDVCEPVTIGAHSIGVLVALRLAQRAPGRVRAVVAFGPPLYPDDMSARRRVRELGWMVRFLGSDTPPARIACRWMCAHRGLAGALATAARPDLPPAIARDTVSHTWASYSQTFAGVLATGHGPGRLDGIQVPLHLIVGCDDAIVDRDYLRQLADSRPNVTLELWKGAHDLPLRDPERCCERVGALV
jgi:pimeloyl-ACP methyl ester carboxylesterase